MIRSTAPLTPAMVELLKATEPGQVAKPGPTRAALIRRGLVWPLDYPAPVGGPMAGTLSPAGEQARVKALPAEPALADPLEAAMPASAADRYFTEGCGADTLKRDALEAEWERVDPEGCAALRESAAALGATAAQMHLYGQKLPQREPGRALVEELLGGEVDKAMGLPATVTEAEAAEVVRAHALEKLTPVNPLSVLLRPVRGGLVDRATRETFVAVGSIWGALEGSRVRIMCGDSSDMLHSRPLLLNPATNEPQWALEGDKSRDTAWPLLEGTVVQINGWVSYQVQARPGYALPHLVRIN